MSQAKASAHSPAQTGDRPWQSEEGRADYQRRLRAAGIDPDAEPPPDMDAFRNQLARRIAMFINAWRGCKEPLCRRNRGCMAPDIHCANVARPSPEQLARDWPRVQAAVSKALQAEIARRGLEDE
jgi:hypothetical protein